MASVLARLRAVLAVLFNRPLPVKLRSHGKAHFFPGANLVLPSIAGADGDDDDDDKDKSGDKDDDDDKSKSDDGDDDDQDDEDDSDSDADGKEKDAEYWRKQHRRYERTVKRKRERDKKELKEAQDALKKREDADKSEQQKAIDKAKEEGRTEALTEAEKERRSDRLEVAVTRAAGKKIQIGEGDDAKQVRFDDPEDAEIYLRRMIDKGDLDEDDLFDDNGKVKADAVTEALTEILEDKPRLAEDSGSDEGKGKKADGDADQGKGKGKADGDEDSSVESEFNKIRRHKD